MTASQKIDLVIEQIKEDLAFGDVTALQEMLANLPDTILENYLSDEKLQSARQ